ncbi:ABC transporter substrate-binding protein [Gammaproteobacteria bacterium]|nr:ABC transporter substrate-binding protein [Gammaproteobacteria bacterium]
MKLRCAKAVFFFATVVWGPAFAGPSPDLLVRETTDKVLSELNTNRASLQADVNLLYRMVDEIVLPHFDFQRMSKLVLGKHWKKVNDSQRQKFKQEFKALLVRTYATALFEYSDQKIVYKPYRGEEGSDRVVIKTRMIPSDGPVIPIDYALAKGGDDAWRVYDVRIDEISMVTNYRGTYGKIIESRGMDALIELLAKKREALTE